MIQIHVSLNYHRIELDKLDTFGEGVSQGIFGNDPPFTAPPITQLVLDGAVTNYVDKRAAYKNGGRAQKGPFQAAKKVLMDHLDTLADYVDELADGDENIILLSGFLPTKGEDTPSTVPATPVAMAKRGESTGIILAECPAIPGAEYYGCIVSEGQPLSGAVINGSGYLILENVQQVFGFVLTKGRKKVLLNNVPGNTYYIYFYAVNAAGVSQLSVPVTVMAA